MAKIIKAVFGAGERAKVCPQWQYDYNTVLQIVGLDLPDNYEVDFANSATGQSQTVIGNADGCVIPAQYFIPGTTIYAWVFVAGNNYGFTRAQIEIPISTRAVRTGEEPTPAQQSALDEAIALLNSAAESIPTAINTALAEAKASGEFDGPQGDDGISPTVTVTDITGGHRVTITDADGDHTFDVMDGTGGGGSDDVYWVTPGVDSYADIVSLQAQNKLLAISYNSRIYTLQFIENAYAWFCSFASGNFYYLKCVAQNSSWLASYAAPYAKPSDGIPKTDLASGVQTSLGLADTAYQKPSGGIPASDLASAVRTSLSKADTALQFAPVSSVNGQTGAVSLTIPSTASDVGAVAANQGSGNAGKFLVVGNDGVVTTMTLATWQASSY